MLIKLGQLGKMGDGLHPGFKKLMQVFGSAPVYDSTDKKWYYPDSTGNTKGAKMHGWAIEASSSQLSGALFTLQTAIELDIKTDGLKYEWTSMRLNSTNSGITGDNTSSVRGLTFTPSGLRIYGWNSSNLSIQVLFTNIKPTYGVYYRFRISTVSGICTCLQTTTDDENFNNPINSQSLDISALADYVYVTNNQITGYGSKLNGGLSGIKIGTHYFPMQEGNHSLRYLSTTTVNIASMSQSSLSTTRLYWKPVDFNIKTANGYSIFFFRSILTGYSSYCCIPYENGISQKTRILTDFSTLLYIDTALYNYYWLDVPDSSFNFGIPVSLPSSMLAYDVNNTFFDTSNNPKPLQIFEIPTFINRQWFFNRSNELVFYNKITSKKGIKNDVGKDSLSIGDSLAGVWWVNSLPLFTGEIISLASIDGGLTAEIYSGVVSSLSGDATYLSKRDNIYIICGTHDYNQNHSASQFRADYRQLLELCRNNNPTCSIYCMSHYRFIGAYSFNLAGDLNVANHAGLTLAQQKVIVQEEAARINAEYLDWWDANLINGEDYDGVHAYNHRGGKKLADLIINKKNSLLI